MSVVIIGGNECMVRKYKDLCGEYKCKAKVYPQKTGALKDIGTPDLLVLFTSTVSHTMIHRVLEQAKGKPVQTLRSHTSSLNALRGILEKHAREK